MASRAFINEIRSLAAGGISGTYAAVGDPFDERIRIVHISNNTQGDMMFTDDGTTDKIFVKSGSFVLLDVQANMNNSKDDGYVLEAGTQWSVKQLTAPTSGEVYITAVC